ncbi:cellulose synthase family protein [Algoriphagus limi]|uniref:Glycosyltransferase family 2 protein n=1 Tax=Algoriphagus limi TaxID=2975273 RepID=A0ABT2G6V3_9BACT|nr:cellulose synthase family protein [Algoriphagus limi]MCS5489745.1 glycosyltransferase family 2 protein [Algoriphagus limi]
MPEIISYSLLALYILGMLIILGYSLALGHLLLGFWKSKRAGERIPSDPIEWPRVTVQLPIFNELYVAERLLDAVTKIDYPLDRLEIQVLDDSTDETSDLIQKKIKEYAGFPFVYLHRSDRQGFKAGALKEGLAVAKGDFIAIFDADFLPTSDFLKKTIPYFQNDHVGMVQTRWTHLNEKHSLLTRLQAFALDAHFTIEQVGRNTLGAFINFNGTGGVWRKTCIVDAGNWEDDTLTEDLDLSYRAQKKGWKFVYRPEIHSPAELPPIMSAIKSQQFRWNKGGAECAKKHAQSVLSSKFSLKTKLHAVAHLFNSSIFLVILMVSLASIGVAWMGLNGFSSSWTQIAGLFLFGFAIIALVYFVSHLYSRKRFWASLVESLLILPVFLSVSMGMALHNAQAVWEGLSGKKSPFIRTPKFNLESGKSNLKTNRYLKFSMPLTTWIEGGLSLVFFIMVLLAFRYEYFLFLPFHAMLAFGYGLVFITSFRSYSLGK